MLRLISVFTFAQGVLGSGPPFCAVCFNGGPPPMQSIAMHASCQLPGSFINTLIFSSYGNPSGSCADFKMGTCNALNSSSIVSSSCVGNSECTVFPNTSTFGDPCYGTPKVLAVAMTCSSGAGSAVCDVPPAPPAPVLPNFTATVQVDFNTVLGKVNVEPSIQVVSQHFLYRDSPIHDSSFATLKELGSRMVRFVPWVPYAISGVAELMPPSFPHVCGPQNWVRGQEGFPATIDCGPGGGKITSIDFASYGTPVGNCGAYKMTPTCHAPNSTTVVASLCIGQTSCTLPTENGGIFGTPCAGATYLAVQASCENPTVHTYWNFSAPDALFQDFWDAVDGNNSNPIPNCAFFYLALALPLPPTLYPCLYCHPLPSHAHTLYSLYTTGLDLLP